MNEIMLKEETKIEFNMSDTTTFGKDALTKVRLVAEEWGEFLNGRPDPTAFLSSLDKILNKIDYDELKLQNNKKSNSSIGKFIDAISKKTEKVIAKYTNISNEFESMYSELKRWEVLLQENNDIMTKFQKDIEVAKAEILEFIQKGEKVASNLPSGTQMEMVQKNMFCQRIQDLQYSLGLCEQILGNIGFSFKANFDIYAKLISIQNATIPSIQMHISSLRTAKGHRSMMESFELIDQKGIELMQFASKETVELSKQAVELLGRNAEDFKVINKTIEFLRDGEKDLLILEQKKMNEVQGAIEQLCIAERKES